MPIIYRPAGAEDLAAADAMVVTSINDLTERHGFGAMATVSLPSFQAFSLEDDPDGLWIAEEGSDILGFAWSWVCGDLWFLAQLFVDPVHQRRGIGNALLERTLQHARKAKATNKALITFSFNRVSQGLYIRHGLFPKTPIYFFSVASERVMADLPKPPLSSTTIEDTATNLERLAEIDFGALRVSREKHHRYLLKDLSTRGVLLYVGRECVGYCYIGSNGHIGPLAVTRTAVLGDAFVTALAIAAGGSSQKISAFLPGTCDSVLILAVNHGMRITFPMLLMASPGYGDWTRYLPRNPGFM
jgi:GNAT superfamily N-acetyltransferase